jgi:hypothetical protein
MPGAPGSGTQFVWPNRDLNGSAGGFCDRGETDGTGHIALRWQHSFQPGDTQFAFVDPATNTQAGSYDRGTVLLLVGQASGFMGTNCLGAECDNNYVVLDPIGNELYASPFDRKSGRSQANDPTGGMVRASFPASSDFLQSANPVLDAIDAAGKIRWTRTLPDPLRVGVDEPGLIGVDRKGDVLAIWPSDARYGKGTFAGQWFDHDGNPGPVFQVMLPAGTSPNALFERVGDGLFLAGGAAGQPSWLGQFDARATALTPPPGWLAARPGKTLHMVHGGAGYAVLPQDAQQSANCEQQVEVISPSGQSCGTATFSFGGGSCTTGTIAVGYDGTVVQQGPRERETCSAADHVCTCTYRYWPGFFR